ncbi:ribonuclease J [Patescibacteria group bacterium]|nr:ribonuclease J [Patescibacteria group bacterium]
MITKDNKNWRRPGEETTHGKNTTAPFKRKTTGRKAGAHRKRISHRKTQKQKRFTEVTSNNNKKEDIIPPLGESIRIIPLGGVEEIGRNMTLFEYKNDIIIVDCGFKFKEEDTPGIDYILPNAKYLEDRKEKIRALVITHGHLDHIGGIPYIMEKIGNPPIYSRRLTTVMIKKRQEEFPHVPKLTIHEVEKNDTIKIGDHFKIKFFSVTHTIPDSMGVIIETPFGNIVHTGDLKLDHVDGVPIKKEEEEFKKFEKENVLLLLADSTNVERPGFSIPESTVYENIEEIIKNTPGRLIVGTFASQLERIVKIIEIAEKYKRKVVVEGRSMVTNVEIVKHLGILKPRQGTLIGINEMENYPPNRILVLATGAQGDEFAVLMRTATKAHKKLKIQNGDTVLLSSSIIPGNERAVQKLKDNLSRQGAKIIHYQVSDVHSSGHANRDETAWIHKQIGSKFFIPIHGYHYMLRVHAELAQSLGMSKENIVIPDNGSIIEIRDNGNKIVHLKERAPMGTRMVDGFSMGDLQEVVIRDRKMLSQDGIFVVFVVIDLKTGKLRKSPDIISRGFVYLRESQHLLQETRLLVKKSVEDSIRGAHPINFDYVKNNMTDVVGMFLFQKTNKHPIVIPVVFGV